MRRRPTARCFLSAFWRPSPHFATLWHPRIQSLWTHQFRTYQYRTYQCQTHRRRRLSFRVALDLQDQNHSPVRRHPWICSACYVSPNSPHGLVSGSHPSWRQHPNPRSCACFGTRSRATTACVGLWQAPRHCLHCWICRHCLHCPMTMDVVQVRWHVQMLRNDPTTRGLRRRGRKPPCETLAWMSSHPWHRRMTYRGWPDPAHSGIALRRAEKYRSTISEHLVTRCLTASCSLTRRFLMLYSPLPRSLSPFSMPRYRLRIQHAQRRVEHDLRQNAVRARCVAARHAINRRRTRFVPRVPAYQSPQFSRCASSACNSTGPMAVISPAPTVKTTSP